MVGAASLSPLHIADKGIVSKNIVGTEDNDSVENIVDSATIQALGGNDSVFNAGVDNDTIINGGS